MVLDIESAGPQQPIYVGGTPRFLDIYDWNGILLQALNDAPADVLFPNSDGLNTVSYAAYLEHFDGVTFDWGQSYWGTQEPESVNIAGYAPKYNALYFMVYGTGLVQTSFEQGPILEYRWRIERYIQGVWLKSISAPNAVQGGHSLPVTITLNRPPPRWPYIVGLISPNPALLMPNGTQKQNFYIPAGQNFWTVNLNAQPVAASISMRLVATQDGIYVSAPITVTP